MMTEIATQKNTDLSVLGNLAQEAQYYSRTFANSMLQLGRVFTEAKPLVRHGEWEQWIADNAGCSPRYAQLYMQAYARYGNNDAVARISERGKIFKLLALPAGTEEQFLAENDVSDMTTRQVEEAVRRVREEMNGQLEAERARAEADCRALHNALLKAEEKLRMGSGTPPAIPDEIKNMLHEQARSIDEKNTEISRVAEIGRQAIQEANRLRAENAALQQEIAEQEVMLTESQEGYNRLQADLLNMQSMAAKGDAERVPVDTLDLNAFANAVRQFMGVCARVPQMVKRFAVMGAEEKTEWDELTLVIEKWAADSRAALNTIEAEGVVLYD